MKAKSHKHQPKKRIGCTSIIVAVVVIILVLLGLSQVKTPSTTTSNSSAPYIAPTRVMALSGATSTLIIRPTTTPTVALIVSKAVHPTFTPRPSATVAVIVSKVIHPTFTPRPQPTAVPVASGSTCKDGTHSNSTGRGTCSHHGGVAHSP